jgi:hypothetical protein
MANFPTIAIGLPFVKAGGFSAQALAWRTSIGTNGGSITDATLAIIDNNFFKPAFDNGLILSKMDCLYLRAGLGTSAANQIAANTNLISSNFQTLPVSSPTFDNNGYKTSGTSYLNLQYNPSSQGVQFTQNKALFFCIVKDPTFSSIIRVMGGRISGVITESYRLASPSRYAGQINDGGVGATANTNVVTSGNVFLATVRTSPTAIKNIIDTNEQSGTTTSTGLPNTQMFELTQSNAGSAFGNYDTDYHKASGYGSSDCDYATMRTLLLNTLTALGV